MYDNIGKKVKVLAKVIAILGIIASAIAGISQWVIASQLGRSAGGMVLSGLITIVVGVLISWISSWALYAIGEAADNSTEILGEVYALKRESELRKTDNHL